MIDNDTPGYFDPLSALLLVGMAAVVAGYARVTMEAFAWGM